MRRARRSALLAAALAVPLLAGCGGSAVVVTDEEASSPAAAVRAAAKATRAAPTATFVQEVTGPEDDGEPVTMITRGSFRTGERPALWTVSEEKGRTGTVPESEHLVFADVMYVRSEADFFGADGKWVKFPLEDDDATLGWSNPVQMIDLLLSAQDVREAGTETVGGVATTRYAGSVGVAEFLAAFPEAERADMRQSMLDDGVSSMAFEAWVDDAQRIRRSDLAARTDDGPVRMRTSFADFGKPVDIAEPPASEVTEAPDFADHIPPGADGTAEEPGRFHVGYELVDDGTWKRTPAG